MSAYEAVTVIVARMAKWQRYHWNVTSLDGVGADVNQLAMHYYERLNLGGQPVWFTGGEEPSRSGWAVRSGVRLAEGMCICRRTMSQSLST